jgi:hypothetical protein
MNREGRAIQRMRARTLLMLAFVVLASALEACGRSNDDRADVAEAQPAAMPSEEASESPPNASVGYDYQDVKPSKCETSESLGKKGSIDLVIPADTNVIGTPFIPMCITDVKVDEVEVTISNEMFHEHNFIVEGNDFELALPPQDSASVTVALGSQKEIGFQCTIHAAMYGAFFR